mgnify:FL=1
MKMTIGQKIMLIGVLPTIVAGFFIYTVLTEKIKVKAEIDKVCELSQYVTTASGLVHELQKERAASTIYVGSSGNKMKDVMEENRRNTDKALVTFQQLLSSFDAKQYSSNLNSMIGSIQSQLNDLSGKRNGVASLSLTKDNVIQYYTTLIAFFIQSFENVTSQTSHPLISPSFLAYTNFLAAKELAGIERATMCGIVAANKAVDVTNFSNWLGTWKWQEKYLQNFESLASQEVLSFYKSNHAGQVVEAVSEIRKLISEKANEGNFGILGDDVYKVTTDRIDLMKKVEDFQAVEIQNISKEISTTTRNAVIAYLSIGIGALVTVLSLIFIYTFKITGLLRDVIAELTRSSIQSVSASEQISASSQGLSEATSEQAASVEETSSTMEEISSMTKQNADNAAEASKLAKACSNMVEHGNSTVIEMDDAMKNISDSSGKIAEIIKIIEGIAFQTNLLALNAAVEAARAGEHGRGFAVVAEEVRNLAQRSSAASKDITTLITDSVKKAENGTELVKKTKEVFSGVVTQVKKVTDLVNEIATSSEEQTNGIDQISKAIQQMDQVVQQNAANAEETASASEELSSQAQELSGLVDKIAEEVGRKSDRSSTVSKPAVMKKKETEQKMVKGTFTPSYKSIPSIHKETSGVVKRKTVNSNSDAPVLETRKEGVLASDRRDSLFPIMDDEAFKDF